MKTIRTFFLVSMLALIVSCNSRDSDTGSAAQALESCGTTGDQDGDLVPDNVDSSQNDSCTATATGFEDCTTGAGDGIPDCE